MNHIAISPPQLSSTAPDSRAVHPEGGAARVREGPSGNVLISWSCPSKREWGWGTFKAMKTGSKMLQRVDDVVREAQGMTQELEPVRRGGRQWERG